jgi:hypothetical protein
MEELVETFTKKFTQETYQGRIKSGSIFGT